MRISILFGLCLLACSPASNGQSDAGPADDAGSITDGAGGGALPVDCKNLSNLHTQACTSPTTYDKSKMIGTGPHFVDTLDVVHRGFTDKTRIIAALGTANGGVILAVDVGTGNRTVISGPSVGTGAALPPIFDVQPGPDGWYALANGSVWRVDPGTGNRMKVWDTTMGDAECTFLPPAQILYTSAVGGIAIGADSTIYLPITTRAGNDIGAGIISIKAATCKLVSHSGYPMAANHGTGPDVIGIKNQFSLSGTTLTILDMNQIGTVDLVTGNRAVVSSDMMGSGPRIGGDSMGVTTGFAWTACSTAGEGRYVKASTTSGTRTGIDPYLGTPLSGGGPWCLIWVHPTAPLLVVEDANGFALFDPATGNSNVFSY